MPIPFPVGHVFQIVVAIGATIALPAQAATSPARSSRGMVVTSQHHATDVGAGVLRRGGNAIDAAVAVGYALAVVHPCCGNIGGGGFMMIHTVKGADTFIDFRERAPLAATADMYLDADGKVDAEKSLDGYLGVGTPGSVAGLEYARRHYGTMARAALIAPSIALARDGFMLEAQDVELLGEHTAQFQADPPAARMFLNAGRPYAVGERFVQPDLARTLGAIASGGEAAFYRGPIAREIVAASHAHGGLLTLADFADYRVEERPPVACDYRGFTVLLPPPPSSGGVTICEMFGILSGFDKAQLRPGTADADHLLTEAARRGYFDRNKSLGDPDFVPDPTARLLAPAYLATLRASVSLDHATPSASLGSVGGPPDNRQTTHYSVVDRWGNAVSVTYTINDGFGAKVVAGRTGVLLNDEMDDFTSKPGSPNVYGLIQGKANAIGPGKRPLSSMSPAIVLEGGQVRWVLGAPGGARIITTVAQVLSDMIDGDMTPRAAVDAPRWHHQWLPDVVSLEAGALPEAERAKLTAMGHRVEPMDDWKSENAVELIAVSRGAGGLVLEGVNDRRAPSGSAKGP
jgi:gamma-glutamyltranspeptidase/glutathione hydrolase